MVIEPLRLRHSVQTALHTALAHEGTAPPGFVAAIMTVGDTFGQVRDDSDKSLVPVGRTSAIDLPLHRHRIPDR